jgi:uncharacterized protein
VTLDVRLKPQIDSHPYPLLFATISGAHLYGFPSPDSDVDLRGVHVLSLHDVLGLETGEETVERSGVHDGLEIDLVTHDVKKFMQLMLRRNGYVLEQLLSPLVELSTPEHDELRSLATGCVTKHHSHHYLGFAATQWKLFSKESPPRVKPLLYVFRVLLTGIHLMRSGAVEANVVRLNDEFNLPYIPDLVARKTAGPEKGTLDAADLEYFENEYQRLTAELEAAHESSRLPELPTAGPAISDLLRRIRLAAM